MQWSEHGRLSVFPSKWTAIIEENHTHRAPRAAQQKMEFHLALCGWLLGGKPLTCNPYASQALVSDRVIEEENALRIYIGLTHILPRGPLSWILLNSLHVMRERALIGWEGLQLREAWNRAADSHVGLKIETDLLYSLRCGPIQCD